MAGVAEEAVWTRRAEQAMTRLARRGTPFTSADLVREVGPPPTPSLLAALVRAAHRRRLIERDERAPMGTVWVGASPDHRPERVGAGRRRSDGQRETPIDEDLWRSVRKRAAEERVGAEEVLSRALRAYLKRDR